MESQGLALLYVRVSTTQQAVDGVSLGAQVEIVREEGRSGKSIKGRPALRSALDRLNKGSAAALFVTRVDRLARSTKDFLSIIDQANQHSWRLVLLDLNLDTSTYQGRFVVTIMGALAEMERAIIAERQKDVHRDRRAQGKVWGVDIGPKSKIPLEVMERIKDMRKKGLSYHAIANELNVEGVPTALKGDKWHGSTVRKALL
jgi:site-specific DNA recombinase